jgi:pilus assembly protein CpaF
MMSDVQMPLTALRVQLASAIDFIVQTARLHDGSRRITHVTEVCGFDSATGEYVTQDIFVLRYADDQPDGHVVAEIVPTGVVPRTLPAIKAHGYDLPPCVHAAARRVK